MALAHWERLGFVDLRSLCPNLAIELIYATDHNFVGRAVYGFSECLMRLEAATALVKAIDWFADRNLFLKIWDAYRPPAVQQVFWDLIPDERYIARPDRSRHSRGTAVDLTLLNGQGKELAMPTPFDDFSEAAHRDYADLAPQVILNRSLLFEGMGEAGFDPLPTEWWHFDLRGWEDFPIVDLPISTFG